MIILGQLTGQNARGNARRMGRQYGRPLINDGRLGERVSGGSKCLRKPLTRRSRFNPPVGGADIAFAGEGDRVGKETWLAEEHPRGASSLVMSVRMRNISRSSDVGRTVCNDCDALCSGCVTAG